MIFNGDPNNQDLVSLLNDITNMDDLEYPLINKVRDMNQVLKDIWCWIHEAYGGWMYDDANNTLDFPSATASLVANQRDYSIPSDALTVRGLEVKTQNGGVWQKLTPATEEQIRDIMAEKQFMITPSMPIYYVPYANSFKIYPAANYNQASSIRVSYERGATYFTPTDTSKAPGFNVLFHEAVSWGAAALFGARKGLAGAQSSVVRGKIVPSKWDQKMSAYEQRIKSFYSARYKQLFPERITVSDEVRAAQ